MFAKQGSIVTSEPVKRPDRNFLVPRRSDSSGSQSESQRQITDYFIRPIGPPDLPGAIDKLELLVDGQESSVQALRRFAILLKSGDILNYHDRRENPFVSIGNDFPYRFVAGISLDFPDNGVQPWTIDGASPTSEYPRSDSSGQLLRNLLLAHSRVAEKPSNQRPWIIFPSSDAMQENLEFKNALVEDRGNLYVTIGRKIESVLEAKPELKKFDILIKRENLPALAIDGGRTWLGKALNGSLKRDAEHRVSVTVDATGIRYDVISTYYWHDEFDFNDHEQLWKSQRSFFGKLASLLESGADLIVDKGLDAEFWLTITSEDKFSGKVPRRE